MSDIKYTSAAALLEALIAINKTKQNQKSFLVLAAEYFEIDTAMGQAEAGFRLSRLVWQIHADIDKFSSNQEEKNHLKDYARKFDGIRKFSEMNLDIEKCRGKFLSKESLARLRDLDFALRGHVEHPDLREKMSSTAAILEEAIEEIRTWDIDESKRGLIIARIMQVISAIKHFRQFGEKDLLSSFSLLASELVIENETFQHSERAALKRKISNSVRDLLSTLKYFRVLMGDTSALLSSSESVTEQINDMFGRDDDSTVHPEESLGE